MNSRIIAIIIAFASLLAAVPDSAGRWFYLQRVAQEITFITRAEEAKLETPSAPADTQNMRESSLTVSGVGVKLLMLNSVK